MARTITALFDTRADADAGAERLRRAGVDAGHVRVHDRSSHTTAGGYSTANDPGLWASIRNVFVPHEDRHVYDEGIRRGGFLLTADVDDDGTPAAVRALEEANSVDLDARSQQWRSEGWEHTDLADGATDADEGVPYGTREVDVGGSRYRSYVSDRR